VTTVPWLYVPEQSPPQLMPAGFDVMSLPGLPSLSLSTVSVYCLSAKVAVTVRAWLIETVQLPVPGQLMPLPDQPVKFELGSAVATSVTFVPAVKPNVHVEPQSMPAGIDWTVPVPLPLL